MQSEVPPVPPPPPAELWALRPSPQVLPCPSPMGTGFVFADGLLPGGLRGFGAVMHLGGQARGGGLAGWGDLEGSFLGPPAAAGHQQCGRGLSACRVDVRPQRGPAFPQVLGGTQHGGREGSREGAPPQQPRGSHWILKSGGSSLMLETAMWPVSPSSNSTTTESRSSSSSLQEPGGEAQLSRRPSPAPRGSPRPPGGRLLAPRRHGDSLPPRGCPGRQDTDSLAADTHSPARPQGSTPLLVAQGTPHSLLFPAGPRGWPQPPALSPPGMPREPCLRSLDAGRWPGSPRTTLPGYRQRDFWLQ